MSLQSANDFVQAVAKNPGLAGESKLAAANKSPADAALAMSQMGKREGYDFTAAEALQLRQNVIRQLSESELDSVAGGAGGDATTTMLTQAGSIVGGEVVPGGGFIGAGIGAGIGTAIGGGSTQESVVAGLQATDHSMNSARSVVQQVFSGW